MSSLETQRLLWSVPRFPCCDQQVKKTAIFILRQKPVEFLLRKHNLFAISRGYLHIFDRIFVDVTLLQCPRHTQFYGTQVVSSRRFGEVVFIHPFLCVIGANIARSEVRIFLSKSLQTVPIPYNPPAKVKENTKAGRRACLSSGVAAPEVFYLISHL